MSTPKTRTVQSIAEAVKEIRALKKGQSVRLLGVTADSLKGPLYTIRLWTEELYGVRTEQSIEGGEHVTVTRPDE